MRSRGRESAPGFSKNAPYSATLIGGRALDQNWDLPFCMGGEEEEGDCARRLRFLGNPKTAGEEVLAFLQGKVIAESDSKTGQWSVQKKPICFA